MVKIDFRWTVSLSRFLLFYSGVDEYSPRAQQSSSLELRHLAIIFKVLFKFLTHPFILALSGDLLYMHCSHLYRRGDNTQVQHIV